MSGGDVKGEGGGVGKINGVGAVAGGRREGDGNGLGGCEGCWPCGKKRCGAGEVKCGVGFGGVLGHVRWRRERLIKHAILRPVP